MNISINYIKCQTVHQNISCSLWNLPFQVDTYSQTHIPDWHTPAPDSGRF